MEKRVTNGQVSEESKNRDVENQGEKATELDEQLSELKLAIAEQQLEELLRTSGRQIIIPSEEYVYRPTAEERKELRFKALKDAEQLVTNPRDMEALQKLRDFMEKDASSSSG